MADTKKIVNIVFNPQEKPEQDSPKSEQRHSNDSDTKEHQSLPTAGGQLTESADNVDISRQAGGETISNKSLNYHNQSTDSQVHRVPSAPRNDSHASPTASNEQLTNTTASKTPHSVFTATEKLFLTVIVTFATFFSPLSASIYFPAMTVLQAHFAVTPTLLNLTLTSYMLFQGLSPSFFGPLSDAFGRRPVYLITFTIYFAANIGLAVQNSYATLLVLRCLQSAGSSVSVALSMGTVADISGPEERGKYIGLVMGFTLLAPAVGPVIGGLLAKYLGWRAIFWFLVIASGVFLVVFTAFAPETGRKIVGDGSLPAQSWNRCLLDVIRMRRARRRRESIDSTIEKNKELEPSAAKRPKPKWPNPFGTFVVLKEKDVTIVLWMSALLFAAFYDITVSLPFLFQQMYGFDDLKIGLCYL